MFLEINVGLFYLFEGLFHAKKIFAEKKTAKINAITKSKVVQKVEKFQAPYTATLRNPAEKDHPNFRLDTIMG